MNNLDISIVKGDQWAGLRTTIYKNNSALDLTGAIIRLQLRKNAGDCQYILEFSSLSTIENVITITEPLSGMFTIEPQIIDIIARSYLYDMEIKLADESVITVLKGQFIVEQDITQ